jgi:aspartyl-tRNA(Asn)/glutamyl-tRNA(Gln) amidotransferase subunit A
MSAAEIAVAVRAGDVAAREVTDAVLERIAAVDSALHAYVQVLDTWAREQADRIDRLDRETRQQYPLAGVPIAVKDNLATEAGETTAGSRILAGFRAGYTATAVRRLMAAGAVVVGKTNLDEFAMGSSTEHAATGPTRNPWDLDRVPGGSSGGSAAAVAAGMAPVGIGSDTGGSIRQPAAFCGVIGMKPTYGRVSRYGLLAYASSLDQIGPLTRTVADQALVLEAMAGRDPLDATSSPEPVPSYAAALARDVKGLKVGVPTEYFEAGTHPGVRQRVEEAIRDLADAGADIVPVSLPHTRYGISAYYLIAPAEASSNLARYDGIRFGYRAPAEDITTLYGATRQGGFGAEVKRRIMLGTYALSAGYYDAYYLKALRVRTLIVQDFRQVFEQVDALVTPTTPEPAFRLGERLADPWTMYLSDVYTVGVNLAGLPALSFPVGLVDGLPVGAQVIAPWFREDVCLTVARQWEVKRPLSWPEPGR